jgi:UDP-N-acetylmuramoyl-tripeptide--D-alanyl-D-alanine ligase
MVFEYYLLLILAILPILYKYSFWFYVVQLKEYRWDRFKEYLNTNQWKSALINIWSLIELPLFLMWFIVLFNSPFKIINFNILFYFLIIYNLFVIWKIVRKKLIKPKITARLLVIISLFLLWWTIDLYYIMFWWYQDYIFIYIPFVLFFSPIIIFFYVLISLPLVNHLKNKKIRQAIKKSHKNTKTIKIGITWSYWKSSVKEYLSTILEQDWKTLKTPENINTELWVSDIIINKLKNKYKYFIAEMWAYKIWEINLLWKIVNHKYGFLTAIWNQHIALFWSQKNIQKAKSELANSILRNDWILYINWNNNLIRETKFNRNLNIVKYWNFKWADAKYNIVWIKNWITKFEFLYKKHSFLFETKLLWEHNIINLTWVIAFCYDLWLTTLNIKKYLKKIKPAKNTLNIIKNDKYIIIDDSYNLSEDGLYAWLNTIQNLKWNKILVLDDILELWKDAENIHFEIWKKIASNNMTDQILFCGSNYKKSFVKWLINWWFKQKYILQDLDNIKEKSIILFEWRNAWKYINKLKINA